MRIKYYIYKYKYEGHCTLISDSYDSKSKTIEIELTPEQETYISSLSEVAVDYGFFVQVASRYYNKVPRSYDEDNHTIKILVPEDQVGMVKKHSQQFVTKWRKFNATKSVRRKREWRMRHFYFGMHSVVDQTRKAYLIRLSSDASFWFPKGLVRKYDGYYVGVIIDEITLKDAETDDSLSFKDVWRHLGNRKKALRQGGVIDDQSDHHVPQKITPKEVKADDRLKR